MIEESKKQQQQKNTSPLRLFLCEAFTLSHNYFAPFTFYMLPQIFSTSSPTILRHDRLVWHIITQTSEYPANCLHTLTNTILKPQVHPQVIYTAYSVVMLWFIVYEQHNLLTCSSKHSHKPLCPASALSELALFEPKHLPALHQITDKLHFNLPWL